MKVSIVVPIYNVASYISDCLRSVFKQTYKNIEVIIVNDQTEDESMEIIQKLLEEVPASMVVKIVTHEKNRGLSAARNTGIENSTGDYLYFLDSDDEITTECIDKLVNATKDGYADMVIGDYVVQGSDAFYPPLKLRTSFMTKKEAIIRAYMKEKIYVMAWNKLMKKDYIIKHQLYFKEGLIHEDCLWSFQCICHANTLSVVKSVTYIYRIRKGSITTSTFFNKEYEMGKINLNEMTHYANNLSLFKNRYVFSFLEEEKLRLLRKCIMQDNHQIVDELYDFLYSLPRANNENIFLWEFFIYKKIMRDAHYLLPFHVGKEYYKNMPSYFGKRKRIRLRFYRWLMCTLFFMTLGKNKVKLLRFR